MWLLEVYLVALEVYLGRSLYVVDCNACILEFKYVGCECVQDFLVAWINSSVVDTCIKELDELNRGFGMMVWAAKNNPSHNWGG